MVLPDTKYYLELSMINTDPSQGRQISAKLLQQRISYCVTVARIVLCLFGTILTIVQIVKFFTLAPDERGFTSLLIAFVLGILCLILSFPPLINNIITKFASHIRSRSLAIYSYIFPIIIGIALFLIKNGMDQDSWRRVSSEGGVSEYGTAIAYLLISVFAYPIFKQFWRRNQKFLAVAYLLLVVASFVVAMEEISWGQRLIGFDEPQFWAEHNDQSEFNFHNLSFYNKNILNQSFVVIGFLGSLSWIVLNYWQKRGQSRRLDLSYILPNWSISSFFYPTFVFYFLYLHPRGMRFVVPYDQEHCEFIMSLGILLFVTLNFFRQAIEDDRANRYLSQ